MSYRAGRHGIPGKPLRPLCRDVSRPVLTASDAPVLHGHIAFVDPLLLLLGTSIPGAAGLVGHLDSGGG